MDTEIFVILDRSGSMAQIADDTIGGFNEWLKTTAEGQKQGDDVRISVTIFDTVVDHSVVRVPLRACPKLGSKANPFEPRGNTALYDAVGTTLVESERHVTKGKRGLAVIITDGFENQSREWSGSKVSELIERLTKSKRWSFVYLGAGIDAFQQARGMHVNSMRGQTVSYAATDTRSAFVANAGVTSSYLRSDAAEDVTLGAATGAAMGQTVEAPAPPKKPGTRKTTTVKDPK